MFFNYIFPFFIGFLLQNQTFDKNTSSITYSMHHKLHAWEGTSNQLNVNFKWNEKKQLEKIIILVKVNSFNSGLPSRDIKMLDVLDALNNPIITFTSSLLLYTNEGIVVKGKLQFHGVTRDVQILVKVQNINNRFEFTGTFPILLEDYKINRPSLLFIKADNQVLISFRCIFTE